MSTPHYGTPAMPAFERLTLRALIIIIRLLVCLLYQGDGGAAISRQAGELQRDLEAHLQ